MAQPGSSPSLWNKTSRLGSVTGSDRRSTWLKSEKMAVLAPMPSASEAMAISTKPGLRRNVLSAKRRSFNIALVLKTHAGCHR